VAVEHVVMTVVASIQARSAWYRNGIAYHISAATRQWTPDYITLY